MIIDLAKLEDSRIPFDFSVAPDEIDLDFERVVLKGDVHVTGEVIQRIAQIDVIGRLDAEAEIGCMRCLEPIRTPIDVDFNVSYVTPENFASDHEREVDASDLDIDILAGEDLDLKEIVREQVLLNLPQQVFCRDDCKGLCTQCGANRNLIDCKCNEKEIDPRWSALKNLK